MDNFEILERLNRYSLSIDSHDAEMTTIREWPTQGVTAGRRHMNGAWKIEVNGLTVVSESSYWVVNAKDGTSTVATGVYHDELTELNGVWKFQKRVQDIDPSFQMGQVLSE